MSVIARIGIKFYSCKYIKHCHFQLFPERGRWRAVLCSITIKYMNAAYYAI